MGDNREFFKHIRGLLNSNVITYEKAQELTKERIEKMNNQGKDIAKKHGKRFRPFTFSMMMR